LGETLVTQDLINAMVRHQPNIEILHLYAHMNFSQNISINAVTLRLSILVHLEEVHFRLPERLLAADYKLLHIKSIADDETVCCGLLLSVCSAAAKDIGDDDNSYSIVTFKLPVGISKLRLNHNQAYTDIPKG
jgi:hypothetical protein